MSSAVGALRAGVWISRMGHGSKLFIIGEAVSVGVKPSQRLAVSILVGDAMLLKVKTKPIEFSPPIGTHVARGTSKISAFVGNPSEAKWSAGNRANCIKLQDYKGQERQYAFYNLSAESRGLQNIFCLLKVIISIARWCTKGSTILFPCRHAVR